MLKCQLLVRLHPLATADGPQTAADHTASAAARAGVCVRVRGGAPRSRVRHYAPERVGNTKAGGGQTERTTGFFEGVSVPHATIEDDKHLDPDLQQSAIPVRPAAVAPPEVYRRC
jgi:hypothetical protein